MAKIPFAQREANGQPITGAELDAQLVQVDDVGVITPAVDANNEITQLAKGAKAAQATDVLHADGSWSTPSATDAAAIHTADLDIVVPKITPAGEIAQLPAGAGAANPTDILHGDGSWSPETGGGGGGGSLTPIPAPTALALQAPWANYGSSGATVWDGAFYYKDPNTNIVRLSGLIKGGTSGSLIAILPAGFRPNNQLILYGATSSGIGRIDIDAAGNVYASVTNPAFLSLSNVSFRAFQ